MSEESRYWQAEMDRAYEFMLECLRLPVVENGEPLVSLEQSAEAAGVEVLYSQTPHAGNGGPRIFVLREGLIPSFLGAAAELNDQGLVMLIEDGYRTREMQAGLASNPTVLANVLRSVLSETGGTPPDRELLFRRVSVMVSTRPHIATHMSGSAIDISVLDRSTRQELDRGGPYLEMSALTPMASPFVTTEQAQARELITTLMARHGFVTYPWEFWHYNARDVFAACLTRQEARYGAIAYDPVTGSAIPYADEHVPVTEQFLVTPERLEAAVAGLLEAD